MKSPFTLMLLLTLLVPAAHAQEADTSGIVAVVNDDVVSTLDVDNRIMMVLSTTQLTDAPEVRARLRPQILRGLIDEKLQVQEATREGIEIKDEDVSQAIGTIEQQRGMPPGTLIPKLDEMRVPRATFYDQVRAQMAWNKLVMRKIKPQVKVSDDEVERERSKVKQAVGVREVQLEVLLLPVDRPENDAQTQALAEKLGTEIRGGAPFESVARELGGSGKAMQAVWVPITQVEPALAQQLDAAPEGSLVGPVRTLEGYLLAKYLGSREPAAPADIKEVMVKDITLVMRPDATEQEVATMLSIGKEVAKHPGTCAEAGVAGVGNIEDYNIKVNFRREPEATLSPQLRDIVSKLAVGGVSEPYASREGIRLFMLCERVEKPGELADREETTQRLFQQKIELEAQKYQRTLRREATVDVRL